MSTLFPMFVKLAGRRCLVVGAGTIALPKIESLLNAGAQVLVVAPQAGERVRQLAAGGYVLWEARDFRPADLVGIFVAVVATSSRETNDLVFREAVSRGVLCNVVDDPERCDFYYPAVVRRGQLQIAVSTGGSSPALAQRIRQELEQHFEMEYEAWIEELAQARRELLQRPMPPGRRLFLLHSLASREAFREFTRRKRSAQGRLV
jgi:precorrin-2 dehydrogenase/sirohydrochlorin ferrochelatase